MPTCVYFLRGVCTREVCPYRHVSVGRHAEVCLDFARGYCPSGEQVRDAVWTITQGLTRRLIVIQCSKRHIVDCPEFSEEGRCRRGDKCLLRHRKKTAVPTATGCPVAPPTTETPPTKTPLAFRRLRRQRLVPESVDSGMGPVEGDDGDGAADEDSCDDHRLSPLDPSCPGATSHFLMAYALNLYLVLQLLTFCLSDISKQTTPQFEHCPLFTNCYCACAIYILTRNVCCSVSRACEEASVLRVFLRWPFTARGQA